jgi:hypothetical protein
MDINSSEEIWEFFNNQNTIMNVDYVPDWNLVGLALDVADASCNILFPESIEGTLFSFNNGYIAETYLILGEGYWLRFGGSGTTTITGTPVNDLTISLDEGWNLIAGISNPINILEIEDPDGVIVLGTVYGFTTEGYSSAEIIEPGKGYWLRANSSGNIILASD